jgi:hypothetical protein
MTAIRALHNNSRLRRLNPSAFRRLSVRSSGRIDFFQTGLINRIGVIEIPQSHTILTGSSLTSPSPFKTKRSLVEYPAQRKMKVKNVVGRFDRPEAARFCSVSE